MGDAEAKAVNTRAGARFQKAVEFGWNVYPLCESAE